MLYYGKRNRLHCLIHDRRETLKNRFESQTQEHTHTQCTDLATALINEFTEICTKRTNATTTSDTVFLRGRPGMEWQRTYLSVHRQPKSRQQQQIPRKTVHTFFSQSSSSVAVPFPCHCTLGSHPHSNPWTRSRPFPLGFNALLLLLPHHPLDTIWINAMPPSILCLLLLLFSLQKISISGIILPLLVHFFSLLRPSLLLASMLCLVYQHNFHSSPHHISLHSGDEDESGIALGTNQVPNSSCQTKRWTMATLLLTSAGTYHHLLWPHILLLRCCCWRTLTKRTPQLSSEDVHWYAEERGILYYCQFS